MDKLFCKLRWPGPNTGRRPLDIVDRGGGEGKRRVLGPDPGIDRHGVSIMEFSILRGMCAILPRQREKLSVQELFDNSTEKSYHWGSYGQWRI